MAEKLVPVLHRPLFPGWPWRELHDIEEEIDRLWRSFGVRRREGNGARFELPEPAVDMYKKEGNLIVEVEAPGMKREDLTVEVEGRTLTISGERKSEEKVEEKDFYRCERSYGRFTRWVDLPFDVAVDKASATYDNGVLKVTLPPAEPKAAEKKIDIR